MLIQRRIIITAAGLCAAASTLMAQDAISPQARETLDQAAAFYRGLDGLSASSKMTMDESGLGENETSEMSCRLRLQRPNRFSIVYEDNEGGGLILTSNGEESMTWMEMNDLYYTTDAPSNFMESVLEMQEVMEGESGIDAAMMLPHAPIMMLMTEGGVEDLLQSAVGLKFVGPEMLGELPADHIIIETPGVDVEMWFASGEQRWLLKSVPDMSKMFKKMMEEMAQFGDLEELGIDLDDMPKMGISIKFEDWKANPDFDEQAFSVAPPDSAEAAESFDELFGMEMDFGEGEDFGGFGDEGDESEMLGRAAPELELDLLGGGTMSLAQHKGKEIVVLDFWATWCPPCREGLPIVAEVTSGLADKGVVFYAVDLREQDEQARGFLEKQGLDIAVAMDRDGASSMPFSLDAIPQTYVIDKDGIVQARHIGLVPNLKK